MNYIPKDLKTQYKILCELFPQLKDHQALKEKAHASYGMLPDGAEHYFLIPDWTKLAPTYSEAVKKVWEALAKTRKDTKCYITIDADHLRQRTKLTDEVIAAQFGEANKGKSVEEVRNSTDGRNDQFLLGSYEVGIMLLTHPDRLGGKWEGIDCPNDEYSWDGERSFSWAPLFRWNDGWLRFDTDVADIAIEHYGSASGLSSAVNLAPRSLGSFEPLSFEKAVEIVKANGCEVWKKY